MRRIEKMLNEIEEKLNNFKSENEKLSLKAYSCNTMVMQIRNNDVGTVELF